MKKKLFDKVKNYLEKGISVKVEFIPHHKGCDISINKEDYLDDYDFFYEQYGEWWYEEKGLMEKLTEFDAYSESVEVEFKLDGENIISNLVLSNSDNGVGTDWDKHYKGEVITNLVISSIKKHLNLTDEEIDEELIYLSLSYDEGVLSEVKFNYDDKEFSLRDLSEDKEIESEISNILSDWSGPFFGQDFDDIRCSIYINMYDENFNCTDIVDYSFEIKPSE
ncbi:hypothetical protein OAF04_00030 [Flavobacteriaceae bacterium]|nr:hypothetical protein [Flavobacteriaceae bacterium]